MKNIFLFIIFNFSVLNAYLIHLNNKCFQEFYDTDKKIPVLAYYVLTKNEAEKKNPKRRTHFNIDRRIPKQYRTKSSDYTRQKCLDERCDRGHQVGNDIVDYNVTCQKYSFLMSNITPQTRHFNRSIYRKIEDFEKKLAIEYGKVIVIEGNFGSYGKIKNNITIPKYFFKFLLTKDKNYYIIVDQEGKFYNIDIMKKYPVYQKVINGRF